MILRRCEGFSAEAHDILCWCFACCCDIIADVEVHLAVHNEVTTSGSSVALLIFFFLILASYLLVFFMSGRKLNANFLFASCATV